MAIGLPAAQPQDTANSVGKAIADFTLKDTSGRAVSLAQFKDKKAVAVLFLGTQCPINNLYLPRLANLHKEFAARDVAFLAINSNQQDGFDEIARHAKKNELPFPVLHDEGNVIADRFGAERNPEVFVLDDQRVIRYQGRIDDQFGFDFQRKEPTRHDLAEALTEVLAGKKVTVANTRVYGCIIGKVRPDRSPMAQSLSPSISRRCCKIIASRVIGLGKSGRCRCSKYDDVVSWSGMIKEVVSEGRMPPWYADPRHGKFAMTVACPRRSVIGCWPGSITACRRGDAKDLPPPAHFPERANRQAGLVLTMPEDHRCSRRDAAGRSALSIFHRRSAFG